MSYPLQYRLLRPCWRSRLGPWESLPAAHLKRTEDLQTFTQAGIAGCSISKSWPRTSASSGSHRGRHDLNPAKMKGRAQVTNLHPRSFSGPSHCLSTLSNNITMSYALSSVPSLWFSTYLILYAYAWGAHAIKPSRLTNLTIAYPFLIVFILALYGPRTSILRRIDVFIFRFLRRLFARYHLTLTVEPVRLVQMVLSSTTSSRLN